MFLIFIQTILFKKKGEAKKKEWSGAGIICWSDRKDPIGEPHVGELICRH